MFFLLRMKLNAGERARCIVTHERAGGEEEAEVLEDGEIAPLAGATERERGWVIPVNPQPGDRIRFELVEVSPIGPFGASYEWGALLCEANGPAKVENPHLFGVYVPAQTADDLEACPGAEVQTFRAMKDGARSFCWTIEEAA